MKKMFPVHTHHPSCMTPERVLLVYSGLCSMYVTVPTYLRRRVHSSTMCHTNRQCGFNSHTHDVARNMHTFFGDVHIECNTLEKLGGNCRFEISVHFHVLLSPAKHKMYTISKAL